MLQVTERVREGKRIQDYLFYYNEQIGEGNFAKIFRCLNQKTGTYAAIKVVDLNKMKAVHLDHLIYNEISCLQQMNHPNTLLFHQALLSHNHAYLITELCNGGTLADLIKKNHFLSQSSAKIILKQIISGLKHLNLLQIVHRDLKPANIFIHNNSIKIADFGFAIKHNGVRFTDINIGSALYMAPQALLERTYSDKTDVWALGVIMYELLHGMAPLYFCNNDDDVKRNLPIPIHPSKINAKLSSHCKNLLLRLLTPIDHMRPSIFQVANHPFFAEQSIQEQSQLIIQMPALEVKKRSSTTTLPSENDLGSSAKEPPKKQGMQLINRENINGKKEESAHLRFINQYKNININQNSKKIMQFMPIQQNEFKRNNEIMNKITVKATRQPYLMSYQSKIN